MEHPFVRLEARSRRRTLIAAIAASVLTSVAIGWIDSHYRTTMAPFGIVSLEFAGKPLLAQAILDSWSDSIGMNVWVALGIGFDYLYLVVYGTTLSLACASMLPRVIERAPSLATTGRIVLWAQAVAPLADAVENIGLVAMLTRAGTTPWAELTTAFALLKFVCLSMGFLFLLLGAILPKKSA